MDIWMETIKTVSPLLVLFGLVTYCVRSVYTGTWVPRITHEKQLEQLEAERARWQASAEKWETIAEGRLKLIQERQQVVVEVTDHVVKAIRNVGTSDDAGT
jgi:hypothetical protein